jgi:hypothetical protein
MIRVDTIRKLVIIAVGGKIGNPSLTRVIQQLSELERIVEDTPPSKTETPWNRRR